MLKYTPFGGLFLSLLLIGPACHRSAGPTENPAVWQKIHLNFRKINADGLSGPPNGQVAVNYEFCIPAEEKYWRKVHAIDPTAGKTGGKGRIACRDDQWLVIGSTHQKRYQRVLYELAALPYVERIEETFWE